MSHVRKGNLTACPERWQHLDYWKRIFWRQERQAHNREIAREVAITQQRRAIDRRPVSDDDGDTTWPDSDFLFDPKR